MVSSMAADGLELDIWGSRGCRSLVPPRSRIANYTPCYSILHREDLFVLDGGRGLAALGHSVMTDPRFEKVRRITLFVGRPHMGHWEGLKDSEWFWSATNGLELEIYAPDEALSCIQKAYEQPAFVPLETLARDNLAYLHFTRLQAGERVGLRGWDIKTCASEHHRGKEKHERCRETLGVRVSPREGEPVLCYLYDNEPSEETSRLEEEILKGAHLAVVDTHFTGCTHPTSGHGSERHASKLASAFPSIMFLGTHHGPTLTDRQILHAFEEDSQDIPNLRLAVEGDTYRWDVINKAFVESRNFRCLSFG